MAKFVRSRKSKITFELNVDTMSKQLFFWTLTNPVAEDVAATCKKWNNFMHDSNGLLKCFPDVSGLRVFEMHKIHDTGLTHGLHIHFLVDKFLDVGIVRAIAKNKGFGRIHVESIERGTGKYLAKYLTKERPECLKGRRLWAPFGKADFSRVKDIVVSSPFTATYALLAATVREWSTLSWQVRMSVTSQFLTGKTLTECFTAQGFKQDNKLPLDFDDYMIHELEMAEDEMRINELGFTWQL